MAVSDLVDVSTPICMTYSPLYLPDTEDKRYLACKAENERYDEWWNNNISSRSPFPIIVNGDFQELGTGNTPNGWTNISSPTISSVTSTGYGNGISITAAGAGQGIEYEFNVKPACNYILVVDIKGNCRIQIGRKDACGTFTAIVTVDHNPGTSAWIRLPHVSYRTLNVESASTDTTLFVRLLTVNGTDTAQFAQCQLWEGFWPRPFQDFRQGLEGYFKKFTANSFIYAGASGRLTSTAAATNGQLLIGSTGAVPVAATLTGTANQVTVTNGAGTITLATPQDIHTVASPTFAGLSLTAAASSDAFVKYTAGATVWSAGIDFSASGAFVIADSATLGTRNVLSITEAGDYALTQQVVTSGAPTFVIFSPAASTNLTSTAEVIDVDFALNRTLQRATGAVTTQRAIIVRAPTYSFVGASTITNAATLYVDAAPTAGTNATITNAYALWVDAGIARLDGQTELNGVRYTWPAADGSADQVLATNGSGALSWSTVAPAGATYVVMSLNGSLTAERVLTGTSKQITVTDGGAGGNATLSLPALVENTSYRATGADFTSASGAGAEVLVSAGVALFQGYNRTTAAYISSRIVGSTIQFYIGATEVASLDAAGAFFIGDTTNANMTVGLTINQGANDDECVALKSSDIAHGITGLVETDTYGDVLKYSATAGGMAIRGFSEGTGGLFFRGIHTTDVTGARSTSSLGAIIMTASLKSGTGVAALAADANLVVVQNHGTTRFVLDSDGDSHQDVGTAWTTFDDYDDVSLLASLNTILARRDLLREKFVSGLEANKRQLRDAKIVSFNDNGHHFVNWSRLNMLQIGAIGQLARRVAQLEHIIERLTGEKGVDVLPELR